MAFAYSLLFSSIPTYCPRYSNPYNSCLTVCVYRFEGGCGSNSAVRSLERDTSVVYFCIFPLPEALQNYAISKYLLSQCFVSHPWSITDQSRKAAIVADWLPFLFISNELKQACTSGHWSSNFLRWFTKAPNEHGKLVELEEAGPPSALREESFSHEPWVLSASEHKPSQHENL